MRPDGPTLDWQPIILKTVHAFVPSPAPVVNGQALIDFQPNSGNQYLMFLKRLKDGRYEPMNGQTDPAFSLRALVSANALPATQPQPTK